MREREYAVLDLCMRLHGAVKGTGDGLSVTDALDLFERLLTRITTGWDEPSDPVDVAVRTLGLAVCREACDYLDSPTVGACETLDQFLDMVPVVDRHTGEAYETGLGRTVSDDEHRKNLQAMRDRLTED